MYVCIYMCVYISRQTSSSFFLYLIGGAHTSAGIGRASTFCAALPSTAGRGQNPAGIPRRIDAYIL